MRGNAHKNTGKRTFRFPFFLRISLAGSCDHGAGVLHFLPVCSQKETAIAAEVIPGSTPLIQPRPAQVLPR